MKKNNQSSKILLILIAFIIGSFLYACTRNEVSPNEVMKEGDAKLLGIKQTVEVNGYSLSKEEQDLAQEVLKDTDFLAWVSAKNEQKRLVMDKIKEKSKQDLQSLLNKLLVNKSNNAVKNLEMFYLEFIEYDVLVNFVAQRLFYENKFLKKYNKQEAKMLRKNVLIYAFRELHKRKLSNGRVEECYAAPDVCECIENCEFSHMECDWNEEADCIYLGMLGETEFVINQHRSDGEYQCWLNDVQCSKSCLN